MPTTAISVATIAEVRNSLEHRIGGVAVEDQGDVPGHAGQSFTGVKETNWLRPSSSTSWTPGSMFGAPLG